MYSAGEINFSMSSAHQNKQVDVGIVAGNPNIFLSVRPIGSGRKPQIQLIQRLRDTTFRQLKIAPSYQPARLGIFCRE
jgi:hypothetical protein